MPGHIDAEQISADIADGALTVRALSARRSPASRAQWIVLGALSRPKL